MASSGTRALSQPLLETACRSECAAHAAAESAAPPIVICVETLVPWRGHALAVQPSDTIAQLKALYTAALREEAAASSTLAPMPGATEPGYELRLRIFFNGNELADDARVDESGIASGARLLAVRMVEEQRGAARCLRAVFVRWLPVWIGALVIGAMFYEGFFLWPESACNEPLIVFLAVAGLIFVPYFVTFSGAFQDDRGHRLLWFFEGHQSLTIFAGCTAVVSLTWLIIGSTWLFAPASRCPRATPHLYYASLAAWALLLILNLPWAVLVALPFLILCRHPAAFAIISFLAALR